MRSDFGQTEIKLQRLQLLTLKSDYLVIFTTRDWGQPVSPARDGSADLALMLVYMQHRLAGDARTQHTYQLDHICYHIW